MNNQITRLERELDEANTRCREFVAENQQQKALERADVKYSEIFAELGRLSAERDALAERLAASERQIDIQRNLHRVEIGALRERLAAVEKAFADAERDRMADIQAAVRQERVRVDAELEAAKADGSTE